MKDILRFYVRYSVPKMNNGKPMLDAAQVEGKIAELAALHESVKTDLEAKLNRQSLMLATALKEKNDALARLPYNNGIVDGLKHQIAELEKHVSSLAATNREIAADRFDLNSKLCSLQQAYKTVADHEAELMARLKELEPPAPRFRKDQIVVRTVDGANRALTYTVPCKIDDVKFLSAAPSDHSIVFTKPGWYYKSCGWGHCHENSFRAQTKEEQGPLDFTATIPGDK